MTHYFVMELTSLLWKVLAIQIDVGVAHHEIPFSAGQEASSQENQSQKSIKGKEKSDSSGSANRPSRRRKQSGSETTKTIQKSERKRKINEINHAFKNCKPNLTSNVLVYIRLKPTNE